MTAITDYHAKYFAWELTQQRRGGDVERISQSLFDASVDVNPHQIDAALFALQNPLTKGVVLADEVGLGKTIEAALVLCQYWAERKRKLLVICPASLRKQWANELSEKFHLPVQILDARTWKQLRKQNISNPLAEDKISILSFNYAARIEEKLRIVLWHLVVMDEAHKLRNAHRESHQTGQSLKRSFAGSKKLLLTATPLQNSLIELYGLSTVIDAHLFGDAVSFRAQFMRGDGNLPALKNRLHEFLKRTLRQDVLEYVPYTKRQAITTPFKPSKDEESLHDLIAGYLQRNDTYGFPIRYKHLIGIVVRKLLASSTVAVIATLEAVLRRLKDLEEERKQQDDWLTSFLVAEEVQDDYLEEIDEDDDEEFDNFPENPPIDKIRLRGEIAELEQYLKLAHSISEDKKSYALLDALKVGFDRMTKMGAANKAVIFTESRRTQDYLIAFLEGHGYADKIIGFSGNNASPSANGIYQNWLQSHIGSDRITGSPSVDRRTALIDFFEQQGEILIATEAGAEGINLQFCSLVINYDLPWNPQRVEQRIGRCHRYGQKFDVVVINFLNQNSEIDRRVLELLSNKFHLFDGVFGASDEVLGQIESGFDIERRIAEIYDKCRLPDEIEAAFNTLRESLAPDIEERMRETEQKVLENFDAPIHELLRIQKERAEERLDRISRLFWQLSQLILATMADFHSNTLRFTLNKSPAEKIPTGLYQLIQKGVPAPNDAHLYRLGHPLGEYVLNSGRGLQVAEAELAFTLNKRAAVLEQLEVKSGWLELNLLELKSFEREEHLVFTAITDNGEVLDQEACALLFDFDAEVKPLSNQNRPEKLAPTVERQIQASLSRALDENNEYFKRERDKLERWSEDQILAAETKLEDTKIRLRDTNRKARQADSLEEQKQLQEDIRKLENQKRRQRQEIFDVEDQIEAERDKMIAKLEQQLQQDTRTIPLFRIRWQIQ